MSDAQDRYLAEIREDCEGALGPGSVLLDLDRDDGDRGVRLVARYRLEDRVWESAGVGENIVVAHAQLRSRLLFDRVRLGFTVLVDRP
jgi:hypothetical protein